MKLSFVISAFERPEALRTCLSSIIQQTFTDWEAIVVDNSKPGPGLVFNCELCLMDRRIRYLRTEPHTVITDPTCIHSRCLYTATELGVKEATGEYLCFPSDDSYYCPWFTERMLHAAEENHWDLVYCDVVMGGPGGHWLLSAKPQLCNIDKTNFILRKSCFRGFEHKVGKDYPQADGKMIEDLVTKYGVSHGRVDQLMVVHN